MQATKIISTILLLTIATANANAQKENFIVAQSMYYRGGVDLSSSGVPRNPIIYESLLLPAKTSDRLIDSNEMAKLMDRLGTGPIPTVIDIERWEFYSEDESTRNASREKLLNVLKAIRAARPEAKLGYYGIVPTRSYWPLVDKTRIQSRKTWDSLNEKAAKDLIPYVDAVFPSLYTLYDDDKGWKTYAEETLRISRNFGKPVYCYLWPQFNSGNKELNGKYVPANFWRMELETCYKNADGIVIWNHERDKDWEESAEWWQETKRFLATHSIKN